MKIGYLIQQSPELRKGPSDGPATHIFEVINELKRLGHDVRLLARIDGSIWMSDDLQEFKHVSVERFERGPFHWFESIVRRIQTVLRLPYINLFESLRFAAAVRKVFKDADLFYERQSWMGYGGIIVAQKLNIPLCLEFNGDHLLDLEAKGIAPRGLQRKLSLLLMEAAIRRSTHVIASGYGWRAQFLDRWNLDPTRVSVVENGTALVQILDRARLKSFRPNESPSPVLTLVYLGGFLPWQGVLILLRAFRGVLDQGLQGRLLLIGSGSGKKEAQCLAHELGLEMHVEFAGSLQASEYGPLLAQADIGLCPYCGWEEYSGLKIYDYKAAGLAIIASGENGHPNTLEHGVTGWIVPPCEEDALTDALMHLASSSELRQRMGQAARVEAERSHGWDHTAQQLDEVFHRVVSDAS